jgi:hypothetical protein
MSEPADLEHRVHVRLPDPLVFLVRVLVRLPPDVRSGVVYEDVERIEAGEHPLAVFGLRDVRRDVRSGTACDPDDLRAEPRQLVRDGQADSGRSSGDQCGLIFESPLH